MTDEDNRSLIAALLGDGRPLLLFTGLALIISGVFAIFIAATGHFLPHDVQFLGMTSADLCALHQCRVVHFMIHDRVAWGGSLISVGSLYMWLVEFPLKHKEPWAWWLLVGTGIVGFGSFLAYLGYGYLDTWHGLATFALLPIFLTGLLRSFRTLPRPVTVRSLVVSSRRSRWGSRAGWGRLLLLATAAGMVAGGLTIMMTGMTVVFVPQDLTFMRVSAEDLQAINPRLVPLIAHDRAGFGGGIGTCGLLVFFCVWCAKPSPSLWQALFLAGAVGFATAIGIHPMVGYNDLVHLAPAVTGSLMFIAGIFLTYPEMNKAANLSPARERFDEVSRQAP